MGHRAHLLGLIACGMAYTTLAACSFGAAVPTEAPTATPGTPTSVIVLPPGALDTATPTQTLTPTPSDTPTPTLSPTAPCIAKAEFVDDVTIPDGTPMSPGSRFTKIWRVKNAGDCAWDGTYTLVQVAGGALQADNKEAPLPPVPPDQSVDVGLTVTLSQNVQIGAEEKAAFELRDPSNQKFGTLTIKVVVTEGTPAAPSEPTSSSGLATIRGIVWNDFCHPGGAQGSTDPQRGHCITNGSGGQQADGILQSDEKGIPGIVVNLSAASCPPGKVIASAKTDASGQYRFTDLGAGSYCVWVDSLDLTNGPILIPGTWSVEVGLFNDNSGKVEATVIIAAGEQGTTVNFGWDYQLD